MKIVNIVNCLMLSILSTAVYAQQDSIAEKMLLYQLDNGAWPKQLVDKSVVDYNKPITPTLLQLIQDTGIQQATLDNQATSREIQYLVKAYNKNQQPSYLKAAERGISYLLSAQYENGGFPQYYPNTSLYRAEVTFNDGAMIQAMHILFNIAYQEQGFDIFWEKFGTKATEALDRGTSCILKTQVNTRSGLSIWAQQYDQNTLEPAAARNFEPASLSSFESVDIVRFLMRLPLNAEIEKAVKSAISWLEQHDLEGYRFERTVDPLTNQEKRELIADKDAVVWPRFYDLKTELPIFADRDEQIYSSFEELSEERRNGYAWFGEWPDKLIKKEFPKWIKKHNL